MTEDSEGKAAHLTARLVDFTMSFTLRSAPECVQQFAKLAILDCLAVAVLATRHEIGHAVMSFARENAGEGPCAVWGTDLTTNARDAALCNGTLAHGLDYDDRNHSSTFTLASSIAAAEQRNLSGADVLEAFIVGREIRSTLDKLFSERGSGIGPGAKGWHSNGILGPIAAACSAGKLLGLDRGQILAAIGLAAGSCGALTRDGGTMAKPFRTGHAAATGVTCALLAKNGFSSDETVLEGRYGLLEALGPMPEVVIESLGRDLGVKFHLENGIRSKPFACCTATHSTVEAMIRLTQRQTILPDSVEYVACDVKPYPLVRQHPKRGFEGRFSMPFCLAMVLTKGKLDPDDFVDCNVSNPIVQDLMQRVRHVPNAQLITLGLKDGTQLLEKLEKPNDLTTWDEVEAKFYSCVASILPDERAEEAVGMIKGLEKRKTVRQLTYALRARS